MPDSSLNDALRHFEAAEANLLKAEQVLSEIEAAIPNGIAFVGYDAEHEDNCRAFYDLAASLPAIDGWKPEFLIFELDEIAQMRVDAQEVGEIECQVLIERDISEPSRTLREYRHRFNQKRRELVRGSLETLIEKIDGRLRDLGALLQNEHAANQTVEDANFDALKDEVDQVATLLGSSMCKPRRWPALMRHLGFGQFGDLHDIIKHDWPSVRVGLKELLYSDKEPIPIQIQDIGELVRTKPTGSVATKLRWSSLSDDEFERVVFSLISDAPGYENSEWLMKTNAPDRGRDLSVYRAIVDSLGGKTRHRVIIQCKHWLTKSIGPAEIATLKEQMKLWEPPRVDVHVIATSGRFTSDAVALIEKHNQSDSAMRIEMWPESHLERLLAARPSLIAQFHLR